MLVGLDFIISLVLLHCLHKKIIFLSKEATKNKAKFRRDVLSCGFCVPYKANLSSVTSGLEEDLLLAAEEIGVSINVSVNADNCQKRNEINLDTADIIFL